MHWITGIGTLPGLNCTENDLAFLQRMQSVKKYEELKVQLYVPRHGWLTMPRLLIACERESRHEILS